MKKRFLGSRSPCSKIIHFTSVKCNEIKFCESKLEYDRLLALEFDPTVKFYEAQPSPIPYTHENGLVTRYTPDLCVTLINDIRHIEGIKPFKRSIEPHMLRKHALIKEQYSELGFDFKVITERDFDIGASIANYRKLYRFLTEPPSLDLIQRFTREFPSFRCSLHQLRQEMQCRKYEPHELNLLMAHGYVQFNFQLEINDNLEVFCNERTI